MAIRYEQEKLPDGQQFISQGQRPEKNVHTNDYAL
jgi:hypothetical protein